MLSLTTAKFNRKGKYTYIKVAVISVYHMVICKSQIQNIAEYNFLRL